MLEGERQNENYPNTTRKLVILPFTSLRVVLGTLEAAARLKSCVIQKKGRDRSDSND